MEIRQRHALRKSAVQKLKKELEQVLSTTKPSLFENRVELIKTDEGELYAINKVVIAFKLDDHLLPSLRALNDELVTLPKVTVDMGAVPYVTNGADIMAPGIQAIDMGVETGTIVTVVDERFGKSLAVGRMLYDRTEVLKMEHGKAVKNLHYVNDDIWNLEL
ncbi:MAG: DUF1947 domain-containing protein [Candidatus Heimdallarchaeota archaeon]|nr:DUF1947 domain-containing protein [Candidatus Heimdallarchaeota archaeon]